MSTAILVRPGETDFDRDDRIQGALDLPLNATGWRQVNDIIRQLAHTDPVAVLSSASEPSRSTAEMIADALDVPLKELEGLENMDQGLWQGMLREDLRRKHPRVYKQWQEAPESVCPPAGESHETAVARVEKSLRKPLKKGGTIIIVASEPLASVVRGVILRSFPAHDEPLVAGRPGTVEIFTNEPRVLETRL